MSRDIRSFDYVNHPYDRVRDALKANATEVFRTATQAAQTRLESVASVLRVNVGGLEISTAIDIEVGAIAEASVHRFVSEVAQYLRATKSHVRRPYGTGARAIADYAYSYWSLEWLPR